VLVRNNDYGPSGIISTRAMIDVAAPLVILASKSSARATLLRNAGVRFSVRAPEIDEESLKTGFDAEEADSGDVAESLAELKAQRVSGDYGGALVIGADQILDCDGRRFAKPSDLEAARRDLMTLRGRAHALVTSVSVVRDGIPVWRHTDRARLVMRAFSDEFVDAYLREVGTAVLECVGAYQVEGLGVQLFAKIEGDHFSIVGLPLVPLLGFLREHGALGT
jgi:septum formation protein